MFLKFFILSVLLACVVEINAGVRVSRSPQFGSVSQASAKASSGGFAHPGQFPRPGFGNQNFGKPNFGGSGFGGPGFGGSGFGGPGFGKPGAGGPGFGGPGFGGPGFGGPGFGGPGFGGQRPGGSINIAKSVSISTGGGSAKSNAKSSSG
ncbi:gastrolith matrix protein-like [Battus philenor]|uniref:gastrolith matrix protein-like n=1 Tax=Battus philenor TaxID=42288 RepID=UPI0035D0DED2